MKKLPLLLSVLCLAAVFALPSDAQPNTQKASMSEIIEASMQPLESDAVVVYKASSLATMEALTATVPVGQRSVRYSQEIVVENFHTAISVCVYTVAAGTACTTDADASCRSGADPKMIVAPSKSRKFRFAGTRDPCAITSAIAGEWQSERAISLVGAR